MRRFLCCVLALLLSLSGVCRAERAAERPEYTSRSRVTMDYFSTVSTLQIFDDFSDPDRVAAFDETWEDVLALLEQIDVLVDGPFVKSLRDETLCFRGSRNQRIIDVTRSLENGTAVAWGG